MEGASGGENSEAVAALLGAIEALRRGCFELDLSRARQGDTARLALALEGLARDLEGRQRRLLCLSSTLGRLSGGRVVAEVMESLWEGLRPVLPFDRLSVSLLEARGQVLCNRWVRSELAPVHLPVGFRLPLARTSLGPVLRTMQPRNLGDLWRHLEERPHSETARRLAEEGVRSSLAWPLSGQGRPLGLLFFSSRLPDVYRREHLETLAALAPQVAAALDRARLYEELVELSLIKDRFLRIAAHDLRTPLQYIWSMVDLIASGDEGQLNPQQQASLQAVASTCQRMSELLRDLVGAGALGQGEVRLRPRVVELGPFLRECAAPSALLARRKGIELAVEAPVGAPTIRLDRERIEQAIGNLLSNAIKFSHPGTRIVLRGTVEDGQALISVEDQGVGIAEEELGLLFTFRGRPSTRPTAGEASTGLGLAIVQRIVAAHGGEMEVRSRLGEGSTFTMRLPLAGPRDDEDPVFRLPLADLSASPGGR
ncbi:MAG TPA: GAF domain-containing sensor histidine kinase [Candidatus Nitrosotenuis sp.]|jgi:signal transduction histidine kinase|nr:GAF domain-containing sensor histidine kinase [Candidatus Nitrosotenuis sp.]